MRICTFCGDWTPGTECQTCGHTAASGVAATAAAFGSHAARCTRLDSTVAYLMARDTARMAAHEAIRYLNNRSADGTSLIIPGRLCPDCGFAATDPPRHAAGCPRAAYGALYGYENEVVAEIGGLP